MPTIKGGFTERDYLKIASQKAKRASDMPIFPKILIYGRKKVGKTTLMMSVGVENLLVIDPEGGAHYRKDMNPYIWPLESWEDTQDAYGALRTGKFTPNHIKQGESSTPFRWVGVDGLTRINNFALHYVRREQEERDLTRHPGFVDRRDYGKSGELMKQLLANFHSLKMGVIYTAHERMKSSAGFADEDDDAGDAEITYVPDVPDAVRNAANSLVDVIGRLYIVRLEANNGKKAAYRRLLIGPSDVYDTGYRSEYDLPDIVTSPTIPKLRKLMKEGSDK
jgi:hypothetical protein